MINSKEIRKKKHFPEGKKKSLVSKESFSERGKGLCHRGNYIFYCKVQEEKCEK